MSFEAISSTCTTLFYFLVVLGLAVFVHEWGHFIVAKLAGAKVDRFAIGFGKVVYSRVWHDTEYCVCVLPLGGYVKIRGMDPEEELTGAEFEYLQIPPWKRILFVFAGPFMNFVLAYLIYVFLLASYGEAYTATKTIGRVVDGSWGWEMGLHEDDVILKVNGNPVSSWDEILQYQSDLNRPILSLTIERNGETFTREKPIPEGFANPTEEIEIPGVFEGILVTGVLPDGAAARGGLGVGYNILRVDGKSLGTDEEWSKYFKTRYEELPDGNHRAIPMELLCLDPQGATKTLTVNPDLVLPAKDAEPFHPKTYLAMSYQGETSVREYLTPTIPLLGVSPKLAPSVGSVLEGGPGETAGITVGSRIVEIDGKPVDDWVDVQLAIYETLETQEDGTAKANPIEITWHTPGSEMKSASITPDVIYRPIMTSSSIKTGKEYALAQIGLERESDRRKMGVIGALVGGWNRLTFMVKFMVSTIWNLFTGEVSVKTLGGPIAIYNLSGETGRWGLERFFSFIALLSANLGILNLFPLPPFDGGHIVFYLLEMIRRKPLTMRQMENFGRIGLILILPLIAFLFWNDLNRVNFFSNVGEFFMKVFGKS